jgi:Cd2+/Zn2+-exporting ATPase
MAEVAGNDITTNFIITGLDCADCAAKLEKAVSRLDGVHSTRVNFASSKMAVTHTTSETNILNTIKKMGYSGRVDTKRVPQAQPGSIWKTNQYALPTLISFIMLLAGLTSHYLGAADVIAHSLYITGILLGGLLPARNGLLMLINAHELDMNILMAIAVIGAVAIGQYEEAAVVVFLFSGGNALHLWNIPRRRLWFGGKEMNP